MSAVRCLCVCVLVLRDNSQATCWNPVNGNDLTPVIVSPELAPLALRFLTVGTGDGGAADRFVCGLLA